VSTLVNVSIVVLSWNTRDLTLACLRALRRDVPRVQREVVVVDNGSQDGSADAVAAEFPEVVLVRNAENRLYAEGNNQGVKAATGEYVCLLNSDTEVKPGAIDTMREFLESSPEHGAVSPRLLNFDGTVQLACTRIPGLADPLVDSTIFGRFWPGTIVHARTRYHDFDHGHSRDVEQTPGAVFMMRRDEYLDMGGLDERLSLFFNDVDLCLRLRKKHRRLRYLVDAEVYHHQGASTKRSERVQALWLQNRHDYYVKHHPWIGGWWLRTVRGLWAMQVGAGILLGPKNLSQKRAAFGELRRTL